MIQHAKRHAPEYLAVDICREISNALFLKKNCKHCDNYNL